MDKIVQKLNSIYDNTNGHSGLYLWLTRYKQHKSQQLKHGTTSAAKVERAH